jgi:DNA-binding GntR family transcriptional regulator
VDEHIAMVQALEARDGAALRQVLMQHLDNKRSVVIEQLRSASIAAISGNHASPSLTEGHAP